ncbi:MAG: FeoA family protein [Candidatus Cloacimonadota bacterium]|nr:FeoA family protein [Candidatus Cloacimonadota bacterium]
MNLTELKSGERAIIEKIVGGNQMQQKMDNLGIRIGVSVKKISSQYMRGPISIQVGSTQIALGYRMAQKIKIKKS